MRRILQRFLFVVFSVAALACLFYAPPTTHADSTYGSGTYGSCTYNDCGISLSSSGTVTLDVTPSPATACTVQKDSIVVTTDSSTGYTLTLSNTDTSNQMAGTNGGTINPVSGTSAAPAVLSSGTWGFRVDSIGGFGVGPTSASSSSAIPGQSFAAVPLSSSASETVATSSSPANPSVTTSVWYGLCADTSLPAGTYSDTVTYTAIVN